MTEIEAQKFITCHTPRNRRWEPTEAKIRWIQLKVEKYFLQGFIALSLSLICSRSIDSKFALSILILTFVLGITAFGLGFWMKKRLQEACRVISVSQSQITNQKS